MFAAHNKLNNLITFVDNNKQQLDGFIKDVLDTGDIGEKFKSFGWRVFNVNGHDTGEVLEAVRSAKLEQELPSVIILDTIKGNGCNFAEGIEGNHHMSFTKEKMDEAIAAVTERIEAAKAAVHGQEG